MADSVARITSMLEKARNLGLEAAAAASARLADTPKDLRPQEVSKLLSSSSERDILKGLKYVISLVSSGEDAAEYFTDVVKNVSSSNLSIRKLVYSYLLRYAEEENDVALLSVNAIQKSIGDKNEQVRALAIRVMSEIRISSIYQIVLLGIKKSVSDPSPIVRRAAAISVINVFNNHGPSSKDELVDFIKQLLRDKDPHVLGSVILAYRMVCPDDYTLLHGHFHRICSMMREFDEWTAIYFIEILTNYSRHFLPKPKIINTASIDHTYIELPDNYNEIPFPVYDVELDQDLKEFLDSIKSSVYSRNEAVILATARAYFHLTPPKTFKEAQVAPALVRCLLTSPPESRVYILQSILYMAIHDPTIFVQYEKRFYLLPRDNASTAEFKLKVLSAICNENNIKSIIHELQYYSLHSEDPRISVESVKAIGVCSQISEYWSSKTLKWLLSEVVKSDRDSSIITEFLTVIRHLVQHNPENNVKTVVKLAHLLDIQDLDDSAKESIIWLIGEFTEIEPHIGPDVLRKLLKTFTSETSNVRYQTILLASKIYLHELEYYKNTSGDEELNNFDRDSIISRMFNYVMKLGRYDDEYGTRDRSRMLYTLLNSKHTQLASLFLQAPKPVPLVTLRKIGDPLSKTDDIVESLPVDDIVKSYNVLPPWCDSASIPPSSIREPIEVKGDVKSIGHSFVSSSSVKPEKTFATPPVVEKKFKLQSLDDFFADEPARQSPVHRRIIYEEETDSDEESEEDSSEEESDDDDEDEEDEEEQEEEDENNGKYETIE
ncbi:AP-3 complex subunit beta [Cyberlindnera jadinii NRRL Y-1542]|uniref:ARM repeat-containing protein n=1 Tax=Cyberlindnera jadinii (strain ATCC 18201 / CBS 1600 / BCRC 20928 / JCM 3617 / NBRC 0987 / NRRL Y-1542) TaxID=983966 RepID=A0A1E4RVP0_CYBJN|nr:ARM repeat-containing protein [Cyberlindnera jadinii NRRL Y-1542]ODV71135.1 ARM repeat-containing protein [Cyberlindnera jadinii NRRL Y-1542]